MASAKKKKKVLFVAEDITLAQVVRLVRLATRLPEDRYEVTFACSNFEPLVFDGTSFQRENLFTIDREKVFKSLKSGSRLYGYGILKKYAEKECELFDRVKPDIVIGDFRLSLTATAPSRDIPLVTLINAYWTPFADRPTGWPMPEHPIVRLLGVEMASEHFPKALPTVFRYFARPVNRLRKKYGLESIGTLPEILTYGDATIFPDVPDLVPTKELPDTNHFLGFIDWSPSGPAPASWERIPSEADTIYVTLGSSGQVRCLPFVVEALRELPVHVILATAGRTEVGDLPDNFHVADYVPGTLACKRASLVISNGGSSTGYQALGQGTPVLGIADNLDQYLAMTSIEQAGAGRLLRAGQATADSIRETVVEMLNDSSLKNGALRIAAANAAFDPDARFARTIDRLMA